MARLSVDLDLVFLPLGLSREEALGEINRELGAVRARATANGLAVRESRRLGDDESQLFVSDGSTEVKIEVNQIFRGTVLAPRMVSLHPKAQEMFAVDVTARVLATEEVYAGKAVAALDRQHPRDLFDVWIRNVNGGYERDDFDVFAVYLAGHNRPPHEVLAGPDKPFGSLYQTALLGMIPGVIPAEEDLQQTLRGLRRDVVVHMSPQARVFLTSFFGLDPIWDALPFADLHSLPALQWKLQNLRKFKASRPDDFARHNDALANILASN